MEHIARELELIECTTTDVLAARRSVVTEKEQLASVSGDPVPVAFGRDGKYGAVRMLIRHDDPRHGGMICDEHAFAELTDAGVWFPICSGGSGGFDDASDLWRDGSFYIDGRSSTAVDDGHLTVVYGYSPAPSIEVDVAGTRRGVDVAAHGLFCVVVLCGEDDPIRGPTG